ncbi:MAG: hypothetical protein IGS03_01460 [Candidatus Sericytochromatia bacterium]|nr:hypothetical protein [Candidatus Sericytochromatia bacterium]
MLAHLSTLQGLLDGDGLNNRLQPEHNDYSDAKTITWPAEGLRSHATVCAPLITLTLQHAYADSGLSETAFQGLSNGSTSPYPWQYAQLFEQESSGIDPQTQST